MSALNVSSEQNPATYLFVDQYLLAKRAAKLDTSLVSHVSMPLYTSRISRSRSPQIVDTAVRNVAVCNFTTANLWDEIRKSKEDMGEGHWMRKDTEMWRLLLMWRRCHNTMARCVWGRGLPVLTVFATYPCTDVRCK